MRTPSSKAKIAIAGAGRMGIGIALAFAYAGHRVAVIDMKRRTGHEFEDLRAAFRAELRANLNFLVRVKALARASVTSVTRRVAVISLADSRTGLLDADIIFEAVPEVAAAKATALRAICRQADADALIASTTSTFNADCLARSVSGAERFLNAHWLNPAHLMPLVEVSPCARTRPENVAKLRDLLQSIGKIPIICKCSPGYIVPRIQALAMNEAARIVEEGVASAQDVDLAVRAGFGLRFAVLGLLEFIDWGGGDILYYASKNLAANLDPRRFAAAAIIRSNMRERRRGLRDGRGFYDYRGKDVAAYRDERLAAFVAMLRHHGLMPVAR